ncbi:CDP-diacylglycerol--glycerol-3-phosphate 3-phosphatidyltransferase [Platysternon megacephalum]|uniref:CDP-diacylglycerol--glycerol-3-phosphate 3-phosphatidyltransferase n=1 Tax=Platysternon megacephalum TaxID=55544 RepID=A0A4D9DGR6_9SAUR|nr:CDP-diacylglycerol--glycerol-3-phosphate 3-phosphatidyltransferase [Platysternon megacephalum]
MMPKEKPLWKGFAFRLCLLSAAVFLCLQLGLRRSCAPAEKAGADAARALPAGGTEQRLGPARSSRKDEAEAHLAPGAGRPEAATASRRRVTYLRNSRRRSSEPACCPLQPLGSSRRKVGPCEAGD